VTELNAVQQSWREAGTDLGIDVEVTGDGVLIPDFGSHAGMLCALRRTQDGWEELRREAEASGAGWSALGHGFLQYNREMFVDALNDWGWFGNGPAPTWYTGSTEP
jgi:hypothetical protein